jgi:PAS domain S-box-containing protein
MGRSPLAPPRTIRGSLLALIAIALVPAVLLGAYDVGRAYRQQRDAEIGASAELARAAATALDAFVQTLLRTEHAVAVSIARHEHSKAAIDLELAGVLEELPAVRDMTWLDPKGTVVASTEPSLVGKSLFARGYFREIAAGREWSVSPLMRSVLDDRAVFVAARGFRVDGKLAGMVAAEVDADALGAVLGRRSGGGETSIIDAAGTLVVAQPRGERAADWQARRRAAADPWVQRAIAGDEALGVFNSPFTGERRVGASVPIASIGWVAHASRPLGEALAPVRRTVAVHAGALAGVVLLALGATLALARTIARPLLALEQRASRLAADEPPAPPLGGPLEVRRVARALDQMASGLAARRAELERVNGELEGARRAAERAAADAAAHGAELEAVMAAMPVALVMLDAGGKVLRRNEAARELLGLGPGEAGGGVGAALAHLRFLTPGGRPAPLEEQPLGRALRGELVRGEVLRLERGGAAGSAWIAASAAPVRDASGAVRGAVAIALDVTHLHELQEERETLMQTVSHDLRTPLHVIVGHAEILRRRGDEEARRRGEAIVASAGRMTRLIGDLGDAARLEAGHFSLRLEPMDLRAFLVAFKERLAGALALDRVRIEASEAAPAVLADPARLDQILVNLVSNALKYSLAESEVRLRLVEADGAARLSVSDRGPGIAPEELPRLFERYYRARSAVRAEGLGLGLFITRKLVEAHGWRIEAESEPGRGSVFTVVIPAAGGRAAASPAVA